MDVVDFHFGGCGGGSSGCFLGMTLVWWVELGRILLWFGSISFLTLRIGLLVGIVLVRVDGPWLNRGAICRLQMPPVSENPVHLGSCLSGTNFVLVRGSS